MGENLFVTVLLAFVIAECVLREKWALWKRLCVLMGILFILRFFVIEELVELLIVPAAGVLYWGISIVERILKLARPGREFWSYTGILITHVVGLYIISEPFAGISRPVGTFPVGQSAVFAHWQLVTLVVLANVWLAPQLIRYLLNDLTYKTCELNGKTQIAGVMNDEGLAHAGMVIGILERLLIVAAAVLTAGTTSMSVSLVGFILGTKSLARFKKFDDHDFVEYFIIGTLASVLFALLSVWPLYSIL